MRIAGNVGIDGSLEQEPHLRFGNNVSHWWDGSQVYGPSAALASRLRDGPKLRLENGYLPTDLNGFEVTGFNESWWLGLGAMHTLFAREHNLLCDELRSHGFAERGCPEHLIGGREARVAAGGVLGAVAGGVAAHHLGAGVAEQVLDVEFAGVLLDGPGREGMAKAVGVAAGARGRRVRGGGAAA